MCVRWCVIVGSCQALDTRTHEHIKPQLKRIIDAREFHSRTTSSADPERKVKPGCVAPKNLV